MAVQITRLSIQRLTRCVNGANRFGAALACNVTIPRRLQSSDVIPSPHIDGQDKVYPTHIQNIVNEISQLTLLEVADLNDLLKKTLNISDAPVMSMGAMPVAAPSAQEEEEEEVQAPAISLFTVKLVSFDTAKKVALIKEIKSRTEGMNLVQAKKFVESSPAEVKKDLIKEDAEALKKALDAVGAETSIEPS